MQLQQIGTQLRWTTVVGVIQVITQVVNRIDRTQQSGRLKILRTQLVLFFIGDAGLHSCPFLVMRASLLICQARYASRDERAATQRRPVFDKLTPGLA